MIEDETREILMMTIGKSGDFSRDVQLTLNIQARVARQKARNPPGLLKEALCSYPEWERDYRETIRQETAYPRIRPEAPMTAAERSEAVDTVRRVLRGIGVGGEGGG